MRSKKWILLVLVFLFAGVAVFAGVQIFLDLSEYSQGESAYEALQQSVVISSQLETVAYTQETVSQPLEEQREDEQEQEEKVRFSAMDFSQLQAQYDDVVGWISIDGTDISYPIMQAQDNNYYLKRLPDGTWNSSGSIFMDFRNHPEFTDRHVIVYGHNMRNSAMFAQLLNYQKQSFFDEHPSGTIFTPQGDYALHFFAGYVTGPDADAWRLDFDSDEDFLSWCNTAMEQSDFESGITLEAGDRVITLSTCSYDFTNARFLMVGVLEELYYEAP